ncbi:MAG: type II toxin-antitoxin system HicA family toxin [Nitrososphaeraceae archaeon]
MSKIDKLRDRFNSIPTDLTWDELSKVLGSYGYDELKTGKTGGSRRKFVNGSHVISLHKPHPGNIVKQYAIKQVIETLNKLNK